MSSTTSRKRDVVLRRSRRLRPVVRRTVDGHLSGGRARKHGRDSSKVTTDHPDFDTNHLSENQLRALEQQDEDFSAAGLCLRGAAEDASETAVGYTPTTSAAEHASGAEVGPAMWSVDSLSSSGSRLVGKGLTRAGQVLAKHADQGEFPVPTGAPGAISRLGQQQLNDILTSPGTRIEEITKGNFAGEKYFIPHDGRGAAFDSSGVFQYFGVFTR